MRRFRFLSLLLLLSLLAAMLVGCGAAKMDSAKSTASSAPRENQAKPTAPGAATTADSSKAPATGAAQGSPSQVSGAIPETGDRKIILNAQFDLKVKDVDEAVNKLGVAVRASGGYVQETKQSGTKQQGRTLNMSLRVPANQYGPITELVRSTGEITSQREWTEDVTAEFVDLEARIQSQEIHLRQLQALYDKGGSIREMMDLENEISRVTSDIESMKGRIRVLSNRVDFSTIVVNLYEPGAPTPVQPPKNVWERVKYGFVNSYHGVVNFLGNLVVFLAAALPVLVFLAIIAGIVYLIVRAVNRKHPKPPAAS